MENLIALCCLLLTVVLYWQAKKLYRKTGKWWFAPLLAVPLLSIAGVLLARIPYQTYFQDTHWLSWLLGPATVAFAIPIYEQRKMIRKHALSLSCGVLVGMPVAVLSSVWLARAFGLSELLQKSLAPRSISTPFAMAAESAIGGSVDLTAVFVDHRCQWHVAGRSHAVVSAGAFAPGQGGAAGGSGPRCRDSQGQ